MAIKQKMTARILSFTFIAGVVAALFVVALPNGTTFAQSAEPRDCSTLPAEELQGCLAENERLSEAAGNDCQPGEEGCCGGVRTSIIGGEICGDNQGDSVIFNLLVWVLRILTAGVGIAAVGGIAYGALLYTTAEGKPDQTKKAIGIITNVVIGIAAYAMMAILLNFLIPGGVFG
jgi:hypothetical protein